MTWNGPRLIYARDTNQNNYIYVPSLAGAAISCCLFGIVAVVLSVQTRRYRIKYTIILAVGAACESLGYLFRSLSASVGHGLLDNFALFLLMDMFVILSPLAFMAGLYVVYGRLVRRLSIDFSGADSNSSSSSSVSGATNPTRSIRVSPLPPRLYTRVFVTCDITSFLIQAAGAGLIVSSTPSTASLGKDILMAGLAFGLASFCTFILLTIWMTLSVHRHNSSSNTRGEVRATTTKQGEVQGTVGWTKIMIPIFIGELCILIRTIYRLVEFAGGYHGHIYTTEWYLYVFDALFMLITVSIWIPFFPAKFGLDQSLTGLHDPQDDNQNVQDAQSEHKSLETIINDKP